MLIAHLSDLHLLASAAPTCGVAPMAENLARCVASVNRLSARPDLVLITGDVTQDGTLEQAEHAASILSELAMPFYLVPGNHDRRDTLWEVFSGTACPERQDRFCSYVIDGYPVRIIALDSTREGQPGGELCPARARWLAARLREDQGRPTIIAMHHPPMKLGVPETDIDGFVGADRLQRMVAGHDNIERILCGHIHLHTHARWAGTVVTTCPSPGMALAYELESGADSGFFSSEPAYLLHHRPGQGALVTHLRNVNPGTGPHRFS